MHSPVLFPKFSKEFLNIQQRRHEPLLPGSQGFAPPQGFVPPPPGICSPPPWEIPSNLARPPIVISLPPKFRDFAPPPPHSPFSKFFPRPPPPPPTLRFRSSYFLYIIGVKNNGEKIGHFDTCTNYSRCSQ